MSDILVTSPFQPFTLPTQFKAVFNGYIYCGTVDAVDPSVSQVQVYLVNEDGSKIPVSQPLRTNAGGFLVYNGQPAKFVTDSNHSLLVQDSLHSQVWYAPDLSRIDPDSLVGILASDDGASYVHFNPSPVYGAVNRGLNEFIYDQIIDVRWFGANGDWNCTTQTGTDDTAAVQSCLDFYATLGSRRAAGRRAIRFPLGNYRIGHLTIPTGIIFGLDFIGDGSMSSNVRFDQNDTNPALIGQVELIRFRDMGIFGSLSDTNTGNPAQWKAVGYLGKHVDNAPDIDVAFTNCYISFWQTFAEIHGRGCVFEGNIIGFTSTLMDIVADPATVFPTTETGMRHYTVRNNRFDTVSRVIRISGTGTQKDYINDILISGNDFYVCDILIDGRSATQSVIRKAVIVGNNSLLSFAGGVVQVYRSVDCVMTGNNWSKHFNASAIPASAAECVRALWISDNNNIGLVVANNVCQWISDWVVFSGGSDSNVSVTNNICINAFVVTSLTDHYVYRSASNCDGLLISGNMFSAASPSGNYFLYGSAQTSIRTRTANNIAPWSWQDHRLSYTPKLLVNGVQSATAPTAVHGRYYLDGSYVYVEAIIFINPAEVSGSLSLSLPVTAVVESAGMTSSYSGHGTVTRAGGFSVPGSVFAPVTVNPASQEAELWREAGMLRSRVTAADRSAAIQLYVTLKYRY